MVSEIAMSLTPVTNKFVIKRSESPSDEKSFVVLPYLFSTDSMGLNVGVGGAIQGIGQEQLTIGGTAYGGNDSFGVSAGL